MSARRYAFDGDRSRTRTLYADDSAAANTYANAYANEFAYANAYANEFAYADAPSGEYALAGAYSNDYASYAPSRSAYAEPDRYPPHDPYQGSAYPGLNATEPAGRRGQPDRTARLQRLPRQLPSAAGHQASQTPLLLRATLVAGLVAAAAASVMRAQVEPARADDTSSLTLGPSTTPVAAAAAPEELACHAKYSVTSRSAGRFTAVVTISNTGRSAVNGWTLRWTYPGRKAGSAPRLGDGWNAKVTTVATGGQATDVQLSRVIPAGGSTTIGFVGSVTGDVPNSARFTLNGVKCA